ncbi:DNA oxidative demethylase ALKBH2 [Nicotiana tomentosiformis]|uniref:DNA oxidative demethylase ALKBH2 n=1 Tax=Nicotiana tomentosiformis TaxID=4098 RepID=UPI00051C94F3|nr:DNA oxidative demethylase ALKBH2 [Nicotiana tomentosiformis]
MAMVTKLNPKAETAESGDRHGRKSENEVEQNVAVAATSDSKTKRVVVELGNGSQVIYMPKFLAYDQSWDYLEYLNKNIPWKRPTIRVFGRSCVQPRDSCYVASEGLPQLVYSGYQPHAYSWDEFPPLKDILDAVHKALPGSHFNSLLLNRYKGGDDYVGWHADDEKLYGPTPEIASLSFGCEREFLLKKRPDKTPGGKITSGEPPKKRPKKNGSPDQHSFVLKHGSLLVMRDYTQRDWLHSVPKRVKADSCTQQQKEGGFEFV